MIEFRNVTKWFGSQRVLDGVSFRIHPKDRAGVVGPNGAGKSTIFDLIAGEIAPDRGLVQLPRNVRLGYVRQQIRPHRVDRTLLEYVEDGQSELNAVQRELEDLDRLFRKNAVADRRRTLERLDRLQQRFEQLGGYRIRHEAERTLAGLGFAPERFADPFRSFSGGWRLRAELARVLVAEPEILLLDEPSNYLDVPAVEWLQRYLRRFRGTLALISHDRFLLNSLTSVTLAVGGGRVERYAGNYAWYVREREIRLRSRRAAARNQERRREQIERFVERFRAKNTKASQVQSRLRMLEKMEPVVVPADREPAARIRLRPPPHCGAETVRLEDAGVTYDGRRWVLRHVDLRVERGDRIALIGLNGTGKTTLLRVLAGALPPSEGRRVLGHKVAVGYQSQEFADTMDPSATVFATVRNAAADLSDGDVRNLLGGFGFSGDAVEKRVGVLSGGEKIRLAFARLLARPPNLLLLDEPTTHLDIASREALENALRSYAGTIVLVSHDIDFVRSVATSILAMDPPGVRRFPGGYDDYRARFPIDAPAPETVPRPRTTTPAADSKAARRERAARRQSLAPRRRKLREKIRRAEDRIETLEKEQAGLVVLLESGPSAGKIEGINRRLTEIQRELEAATKQWEIVASELEDLERETPA